MKNPLKTNYNELTKEQLLDIIREYLTSEIDTSLRKTRDEVNFELPAWSEFQAFHVGQQKAYQKVINFITPLDQRKNIVN